MKIDDSNVICNVCGKHNKYVEFLVHLKDDFHICSECIGSLIQTSTHAIRKLQEKKNDTGS